MSRVDCHQVVILGKGLVVLQHYDFYLDRRTVLGGPYSVGSSTTQLLRMSWATTPINMQNQTGIHYYLTQGELSFVGRRASRKIVAKARKDKVLSLLSATLWS